MVEIVFKDKSTACFADTNYEDMPRFIKYSYDDIVEMSIDNTFADCDSYPKNLKKLSLHSICDSIFILNLPKNLEILIIEDCIVEEMIELPSNLLELKCVYGSLAELPPLPKTLKILDCPSNCLSELPALPDNLEFLACTNNILTDLPPLPKSLKELLCSKNQLSELPSLPENLEILDCSENILINLPPLPRNLDELWCDNNKLTKLPLLPNNLDMYFCENNFFDEDLMCYYADKGIYNNVLESCEKIGEWFLKVKYNPKYKYCRKRLEKEYEELYK